MKTMLLSVVIPTYNSAALVLRCLHSLEQQLACKSTFEVIVVDDGSSDDTQSQLTRFIENTSLQISIIFARHAGPAEARNLAISRAQTRWIAFLDADMTASKSWISRALELIRDEPCVGGYEGRTEIGQKHEVTPFTHQMTNLKGGRFPTCNLLLRKEFCHFNPEYKIAFREDTDLAFTVLEEGFEIVFDEQLLAFHPPLNPRYDRPLKSAMRYYYDGLLERRFPHRYKRDVDVHVILGARIPHLRRKIYSAFACSQGVFLLALLILGKHPATLALGLLHSAIYSVIVCIHLNNVAWRNIHFRAFLLLLSETYWIPWILIIQRWRGNLAFRKVDIYRRQNAFVTLAKSNTSESLSTSWLSKSAKMSQSAMINSVFYG